jgi:hypothetical protein
VVLATDLLFIIFQYIRKQENKINTKYIRLKLKIIINMFERTAKTDSHARNEVNKYKVVAPPCATTVNQPHRIEIRRTFMVSFPLQSLKCLRRNEQIICGSKKNKEINIYI